ncbi:uncharacterized protein EMH_0070180 [Eimeria mitis]|uniref:Uncharacterized protein n=1 Tax=Eimeria mitis TaxID=44415 RepID=U6K4G2_9EIME|nr:uncharacterized protein EMH_0070180 [Eimeria mitis]CDJ31841.1 hypothetical protein EMH_0070180 [Eimeria mitis]
MEMGKSELTLEERMNQRLPDYILASAMAAGKAAWSLAPVLTLSLRNMLAYGSDVEKGPEQDPEAEDPEEFMLKAMERVDEILSLLREEQEEKRARADK